MRGATLRYQAGLPVLTVAGTPDEMGRAIGTLALRPGERMTHYADDSLRHFSVSWLRRPLLWMGDRLLRQAPPDFLAEIAAAGSRRGRRSRQARAG